MSCCGKSYKKYPSKAKMLSNLTLSIANVIAHAISSGKIKADNDVIAKRVNTCKNCRHLDKTRCTACGCFISVKAGLRAESCPLKLW